MDSSSEETALSRESNRKLSLSSAVTTFFAIFSIVQLFLKIKGLNFAYEF